MAFVALVLIHIVCAFGLWAHKATAHTICVAFYYLHSAMRRMRNEDVRCTRDVGMEADDEIAKSKEEADVSQWRR